MTDDVAELHNRMGRVGQALARQLSAALAENAQLREEVARLRRELEAALTRPSA